MTGLLRLRECYLTLGFLHWLCYKMESVAVIDRNCSHFHEADLEQMSLEQHVP